MRRRGGLGQEWGVRLNFHRLSTLPMKRIVAATTMMTAPMTMAEVTAVQVLLSAVVPPGAETVIFTDKAPVNAMMATRSTTAVNNPRKARTIFPPIIKAPLIRDETVNREATLATKTLHISVERQNGHHEICPVPLRKHTSTSVAASVRSQAPGGGDRPGAVRRHLAIRSRRRCC